ncbi:unnamed protein product, partial [Prorocentrum cordatum]
GLDGIEAALEPLGQIFVRVALKLVGKEKSGRDGVVYTRGDMCKSFLSGASSIKGQTVTFDEWNKYSVSSGAAATAKAMPAASATATLDDHKDPAWIAKKAGYSVGSFVVQKDVPAQRLYAVFSIGHMVKLHEVVNHGGEPHAAEIALEDLLDKWSLSKAEPPKQMEGDQQRPRQLYIDTQKAILYRALLELDAKHMGKQTLIFWRKPDEVRTTRAIKQGQLALDPVAPLVNISSKNASNGSGPSDNGANKFDEAAFVAAHWWVATTYDKKQANMATSHVSHGGIMLPVLTNITDIGPNVKPQVFVKPKAKAAPIHEESAKKQKRS